MSSAKYKRIILKISGEALAGDKSFGLNQDTLLNIAKKIKELRELGIDVAITVGGGNFWRGRSSTGMDRTTADHMGMLATVINALALQDALEGLKVETRVQTAIEMRQIAEPYIRRRAVRHLEKGRVVIFASGIGNAYFSTDTTAALRAAEIEADIILMAKKVDGVYDDDPVKNKDARRYERLSYTEVISKGLGVMDSTAASLCRDNNIPILVFDLKNPDNIIKAVMGEEIGTVVKED